jgi:hypothetical protein
MLTGTIDNQGGISFFVHEAADYSQVLVRRLSVGLWHDDGSTGIAFGADGANKDAELRR